MIVTWPLVLNEYHTGISDNDVYERMDACMMSISQFFFSANAIQDLGHISVSDSVGKELNFIADANNTNFE